MSRRDHIVLKGVRLGALAGTQETGCSVDVRLSLDLRQAAFHDRIDCTVDYRDVHECLKRTVLEDGDCVEILTRAVLDGFPQVTAVEVTSTRGQSHSRRRGGVHGVRC
jgi:dihydroneopterin aldolase